MKTVMMVFSGLIMLLAGWIYVYAGSFDQKTMNDLGPALFPRLIAVGLICLSLIEILVSYRNKKITYRISEVFNKTMIFPLVGIILSALYIVGLMLAGYLIATTLFVAVMLWFLRVRQPVKLAVISLATALIIYWLFEKFLIVPLPRGILF